MDYADNKYFIVQLVRSLPIQRRPPIKTILDAVKKGYLCTVPRITERMITLNPPVSDATAKGHLDLNCQQQKAVRRTTYQSPSETDVLSDNVTESSIFSVSDITGRFPITSAKGNQYIFFSVFNNYTHMEPMPNRTGASLLAAHQRTYDTLSKFGHPITFQRMDNESNRTRSLFPDRKHHNPICTTQ